MKPLLYMTTLLALIISCGGCNFSSVSLFSWLDKKEAEAPKVEPLVPVMEDESLAQLVLKPKPYQLNVKRDPFKPLIDANAKKKGPMTEDLQLAEMQNQEMIKRFQLLGIVKVGESVSALIQTETKKSAYAVGDVVESFTVREILDDQVLLAKGDRVYYLKRGE